VGKSTRKSNISNRNFQKSLLVFGCQKDLRMQPKICKKLLLWILLTFNTANCCWISVSVAWADPPVQINLPSNNNPRDIRVQNNPPPLEEQPKDFPQSSPTEIEQRLETPETERTQRLQRLQRRLLENKQQTLKLNGDDELGLLRLREQQLEQLPPPALEPPVARRRSIGYLQARVGYFQSSNIFSSEIDPIDDGLIFSGLTLASTPLPLGSKTFLAASVDGNLIRYINQSQFNYNQVRFNVSLYQQLSRQMYGEIGWNNQQLFYARDGEFFDAGESFLKENSVYFSLGRRDNLTSKLMLDSFYELRLSFTDPPSGEDNRDRFINSLWFSLNYYFQKSFQAGVGYQFGWSDFINRTRQDQYHRLFGLLNYQISDYSNVNLQSGISFGGSSQSNIDFDGWFFSINYNIELGQF
jgi:hypothetical protein